MMNKNDKLSHQWLLRISIILLIMIAFSSYVIASGEHVYDTAEIFTPAEIEVLEEDAAVLNERIQMEIKIVTTDTTEGKSSTEYADHFFITHHLGMNENEDGILFLINMEEREIYVYTSGIAIRYFTEERIDQLLEQVYDHFSEENYLAGVESFFTEVEKYVQQEIPEDSHSAPTAENEAGVNEVEASATSNIFAYLVISIIIGAIAIGVMAYYSRGHSSVTRETYLDRDSFEITRKRDHHYDTKITQRRIPKNRPTSNSRPGSRTSSRRPTTYRSSSGRNRGGGGRKF